MNEYVKQVEDFMKKANARMKICNTNSESNMTGGYLYRIRIDREGKSWSFDFSDSLHNRLKGKRPTKYDVLACVTKYEPEEDIWDFAAEYGYTISDKESWENVNRIHKAVIKEYKNVIRIFGDVLDELCKIA